MIFKEIKKKIIIIIISVLLPILLLFQRAAFDTTEIARELQRLVA